MTQNMFASFPAQNAAPSAFAMKPKRKRMSWGADEEESGAKHARVRSPVLNHQSSFPLPDLMPDHSNSASDDDHMMDQDMDMDMGSGMGMPDSSSAVGPPSPVDRYNSGAYMYESGGSGGFGFGPGAEEDEFESDMSDDNMGGGSMKTYPSLTPHPNPHHFSNGGSLSSHVHPHSTNGNFYNGRATSPLAAQQFSTTLQAPGSARGIFQPTMSQPLPQGASEVEKARAQHGPWCKSIPKLVMSDYPDASGNRSMWTMCGDCGAVEMAQ
ncbi:hypothetical protein IAT38_002731 [Cryptococcus sp. DSM 104549]